MRRTMTMIALAVWLVVVGMGAPALAHTAPRGGIDAGHVLAAVAPLLAGAAGMLAANAVESLRDRGRMRRARRA